MGRGRKFGTAGDAIAAVLSEAESDMRLTEIHREITTILDGPVSLSFVKTSLARNCKGENKPSERVSHGRYRLRHVVDAAPYALR